MQTGEDGDGGDTVDRTHDPNEDVLQRVSALLGRHCEAHAIDETHGVGHAIAVLRHAQRALACALATRTVDADWLVAIQMAALLHDADDHKYFGRRPPGTPSHAARMMREAGVEEAIIEKALRMIQWVSCSRNGDRVPPEAEDYPERLYPRYADRLESMGHMGIMRCYEYTKLLDRPLTVETTPLPLNASEAMAAATPERYEAYQARGGTSDSFVDHFYDKLLHLSSHVACMANDYLREQARARHDPMVELCVAYGVAAQGGVAAPPRRRTTPIELIEQSVAIARAHLQDCAREGERGVVALLAAPGTAGAAAPTSPQRRRPVALTSRYAITFGEASVLHVGGEELRAAGGGGGRQSRGFTVAELHAIAARLNEEAGAPAHPAVADVVDLSSVLPATERSANAAAVLVVRNGAHVFTKGSGAGLIPSSSSPHAAATSITTAADELYAEQQGIAYDRQYYDARRKRTLNKRARHNVVFGDVARSASADFREYTIHAFANSPRLNALRRALPHSLGPAAQGLSAEGNHYYEEGSGIGFHGDAERKIVVCLSLGKTSTVRFHWRKPGSSTHDPDVGPIDLQVHHGDVYVMSEKATGCDWRCRSRYRVVHAAGADAYIAKGSKKRAKPPPRNATARSPST